MEFGGVISTEERTERLRYENPWWTTGSIHDVYREMSRRLYFDIFYPFVQQTDIKRAVVLMGPRRVGKTVMMFHTIQQLIQDQISPQNLFFVAIDNPIYMHLGLEQLLKLAQNAVKKDSLDGCFVFFDEVQYLKDWERHLKVLVDSYPKTKFVASGSAAAALRMQSTESGAGRFTDFMLPPLTFHEYIHLKGLNHLVHKKEIVYNKTPIAYYLTHDIRTLNREFFHYVNFGGYPEVVLSADIQSDMSRYVKSDIVDKVLLKDLPSLYSIRDLQELNSFFSYLAYNTGNEFSYEKMSKESGIRKDTIKKYLEYLEAAFLIAVIHKVDVNARKFQRITNFKVYLTNSSLRSAMFSPVQETDDAAGRMIETTVFSQWMHRENMNLKYARWKMGRSEGEVDMVSVDTKSFTPLWCVEIKWSNRYYEMPQNLVSLLSFCKENKLKSALVTTIVDQGNKTIDGVDLTFLPAALYAYNIGVITLERKSGW